MRNYTVSIITGMTMKEQIHRRTTIQCQTRFMFMEMIDATDDILESQQEKQLELTMLIIILLIITNSLYSHAFYCINAFAEHKIYSSLACLMDDNVIWKRYSIL